MIRYALICESSHEHEAWFPSSDSYDEQVAKGLVECPVCGTKKVRKQIMAPAVSSSTRRKGEDARPARAAGREDEAQPAPAAEQGLDADFEALAAKVRAHIKQTHVYVGDKFVQEARAMHEGVKDEAPIYGEATLAEAKKLREEGVPVAALPEAFAPVPPKKAN